MAFGKEDKNRDEIYTRDRTQKSGKVRHETFVEHQERNVGIWKEDRYVISLEDKIRNDTLSPELFLQQLSSCC